jgi:two-component system response regulator CpxR
MRRVLLIDDDEELCTMLARYLGREGFSVEAVYSGTRGLERALEGQHDVVLLDIMLPGTDGFELLRKLRERSRIPVLMLTARGDDVDRIVGLEVGADDYLPKPFNSRELLARMRAILRRAVSDTPALATPPVAKVLTVGDLELDRGARAVLKGGEPVELTTTEFDVLAQLLSAAGEIVPREDLAKVVFGRPLAPFERSVDMHISKLRRKLGSLGDGKPRIRTVRSVGYLYVAPKTHPID